MIGRKERIKKKHRVSKKEEELFDTDQRYSQKNITKTQLGNRISIKDKNATSETKK